MLKKSLNNIEDKRVIRGSGGGSKKKSRTPVETQDTVASNTRATIIDLLGEGVIGGLINGAKSIYIDKVALESPDGTRTFNNVEYDVRTGTQDQSVMPKYNTLQTPFNVNVEAKHHNNVTVALQSDDNDYVKFIIEFPSLFSVNQKNGDRKGSTVKFKFMMSYITKSGEVVGMHDVTVEGATGPEITISQKQNSVWYKSFLIKIPKGHRNYQMRFVRLSQDEDGSYVSNRTIVNSYIEILNTPFNYPNSAVIGITVNAEDFGNKMPERAYLVGGMYIRVPSNYDDRTNTYNGYWDGTFQLLVSENPAWILFDLITNERYGLGHYVKPYMFNLSLLYQIGVYCDGLVSDGRGGKEKRFTLNTVIAGREEAFSLITDIVSVFRGMVFWSGGMINVIQDKPKDPSFLITNSNVVDGDFNYQGSARKDRPSIALVTWNNPDDYYERGIEYVEDSEAIARFGSRVTEVTAFGCTSQAQAHRLGLWTLYTARYETDLISFKMTQEAAFLMPGDICKLQDKYRAGEKQSGRIVDATLNSITLDFEINIKSNSFVQIATGDGKFVERDIIETGPTTIITFVKPLDELPVKNAVYIVSAPTLKPLTVRVISVSMNSEDNLYDIVVLEYNPSKFAAIDEGAVLQKEITTNIDPTNFKPENMVVTETTYLSSPGNLGVKLIVSWDGRSPEYVFSWRRVDNDENIWYTESLLKSQQIEILNVAENGQYDFQVYGISASGLHTEPLFGTHRVAGTSTPPNAPTQLTAVGDYRSVILSWANPDSVDIDHINIYVSNTDDFSKAQLLIAISATTYTHTGLEDNVTRFYWLRAVNKRGMQSPLNSNIGTKATTTEVLSYLQGKITESELGKELIAKIEEKPDFSELESHIGKIEEQINQANNNVTNDINDLNDFVQNEIDNINQLYKEQKTITSKHDKNIKSNTSAISAIGESITDLEDQFASAQTEITTLETDLVDAKKNIRANTAATTALKTNVKKLGDKIVTQSSDITLLQNDVTDAVNKISANSVAVTDLNTKVEQHENQINTTNTSVTKLEGRINDVETGLESTSTALTQLNTTVINQGKNISSQGSAITTVQSKLDGDLSNLFENPNASSSKLYIPDSKIVPVPKTITGVHLANVFKFSNRWNNALAYIPVVAGETYSFSIYTATDDKTAPDIGIGFHMYDKNKTNSTYQNAVVRKSVVAKNSSWTRMTGLITIPKDKAFAKIAIFLEKDVADKKSYWYAGSISVTNAAVYNELKPLIDAGATATSSLNTIVQQQGDKITSQGSAITSVSASLARRSVFKLKSAGYGGDLINLTGVFDKDNSRIVAPSRSYCVIQFKSEDNGIVNVSESKTFDVYDSADNAKAMVDYISKISIGTYVAIITNDEPSQNREYLYNAIEELGGTRESLSKLIRRSAYILLGQKGLTKGSAVELYSNVLDSKLSCMWTEVAAEFINGAMVNLGGATGASQMAGATASAVTSLEATVEQQGKDIIAKGQQITRLQSDVNGNKSSIANTNTTVSKLNETVATMNTTLRSEINNVSATVSQNAKTIANVDGKLNSMWTVKTQVSSNGQTYVAGIGLSTDSTGYSQFLVQADRFALMNTGANTVTTPFVIDGGTTYINSAMIKKASINSAMIGGAIQSDNYVPNKLGWILRKDGNFEINSSFEGGGRVLLNSDGLTVFDERGVARVKLGKLW